MPSRHGLEHQSASAPFNVVQMGADSQDRLLRRGCRAGRCQSQIRPQTRGTRQSRSGRAQPVPARQGLVPGHHESPSPLKNAVQRLRHNIEYRQYRWTCNRCHVVLVLRRYGLCPPGDMSSHSRRTPAAPVAHRQAAWHGCTAVRLALAYDAVAEFKDQVGQGVGLGAVVGHVQDGDGHLGADQAD